VLGPVRVRRRPRRRRLGTVRDEPAGQEVERHRKGLLAGAGQLRRGRRRRGVPRRSRPAAQPPQLVDHRVQPLARDELHRIVPQIAVLADLEDRHDVGVVQLRRRARLAAEPLHRRAVPRPLRRQDLERHPAAERDLLGLVDHSHTASPHLAEDPIVAHLLGQPGRGRRHRVFVEEVLRLLNPDQRREQLADLVGQLRVAFGVFLQRRPLSAPEPRRELVSKPVEKVEPARVGGRHASEALQSTRHGRQHRLEPLERPVIPFGSGLLIDPQQPRRLAAGEWVTRTPIGATELQEALPPALASNRRS